MAFIEADPALLLKAIEGYANELAPEKERDDAFYRQFRCKRCNGDCRREILAHHCFLDPDALGPRSVLRCTLCSFLFDPHSGITLELGDPEQMLGIPRIPRDP